MAGLIQKNMPASDVGDVMQQQPIPRQGPAVMGQQNPPAMIGTPAEQESPEQGSAEPSEDDPGYTQAVEFAMQALYQNKAAKDIAAALKNAGNKVDAMANTAYEIVSIVDERTEGAIPDELIAAFATFVLEEVAEIADAAGLDVQPSDVALALKQMILRFLGEQGVDTTQLQKAMDQVNPEEFNRVAAEV